MNRDGDRAVGANPGSTAAGELIRLRALAEGHRTVDAAGSPLDITGRHIGGSRPTALVLTRASVAARLGLAQEARIVATAAHAHAPAQFTTAPVSAIRKVLDRAGWTVGDVDLFEVNEAFATVAMIAMRDLAIPRDRLNVNGGATALGHPIGASGARIIATLVAALKARGLRKGVAALCIGGGEATAVAVELV